MALQSLALFHSTQLRHGDVDLQRSGAYVQLIGIRPTKHELCESRLGFTAVVCSSMALIGKQSTVQLVLHDQIWRHDSTTAVWAFWHRK